MSVIKYKVDANLNFSLALKKIEEQDYLFAINLLKEAISINPKPQYYIELAELYYKLGQFEESTATYISLCEKHLTMEVALAVLHSHQTSLGKPIDPNELTMPNSVYFKIQNKSIDNMHLKRIIKKYQKIVLDFNSNCEFIDVKERKIIKKLELAKTFAIEGKSKDALKILDSENWGTFDAKAIELKVLIKLSSGDYADVYEYAKNYLIKNTVNSNVAKGYLYSIYELNGKIINEEFENEYEKLMSDFAKINDKENIISHYELAQMVGYLKGAEKCISVLLEKFAYDAKCLLIVISHYASINQWKDVEKYLKIANKVHTGNPKVKYLNYLINSSSTNSYGTSVWLSVLDNLFLKQAIGCMINELNINSLSLVKENIDLLKSSLNFLDEDQLMELLSNKNIISSNLYEELLVWGIENPYLGLEIKTILISRYISTFNNKHKIFVIPSELGVICTQLAGKMINDGSGLKERIFNLVYPNILFTLHEVDSQTLMKAISIVAVNVADVDDNLLKAITHGLYHKLKNYEPQLELIAGTYKVDFEELKIYFDRINR